MRKVILPFLLLALASCGKIGQGFNNLILVQKYVHGTEDVPVYDGFKPVESKNIVYDSESGRIIDATYSRANVTKEDVLKFYQSTLPQLGWRRLGVAEFIREGELLKIIITKNGDTTLLSFIIRPHA